MLNRYGLICNVIYSSATWTIKMHLMTLSGIWTILTSFIGLQPWRPELAVRTSGEVSLPQRPCLNVKKVVKAQGSLMVPAQLPYSVYRRTAHTTVHHRNMSLKSCVLHTPCLWQSCWHFHPAARSRISDAAGGTPCCEHEEASPRQCDQLRTVGQMHPSNVQRQLRPSISGKSSGFQCDLSANLFLDIVFKLHRC